MKFFLLYILCIKDMSQMNHNINATTLIILKQSYLFAVNGRLLAH